MSSDLEGLDVRILPNLKSTSDQIKKCISINLLQACQREVNFLRMIDRKAPILYDSNVIKNAIRRYEMFWLPMQASCPDVERIPPLDVHWVWHVHMLSPHNYEMDCKKICGKVIDHKLQSAEEIQKRYEQSVCSWNNFCHPEPYDFISSTYYSKNNNVTSSSIPRRESYSTTSFSSLNSVYEKKSSYDILAAVSRQRNFNYQISLPHYTSPLFLKEAIDRYINFLLLKQTYDDKFLTPCYDFDLIWHTHQIHCLAYQRDCIAIFGHLLKHDDSVNDRTPNSKLLQGEAITKKLWGAHFKDGFWRRGCMYRGHEAPVFIGFEHQDMTNITYGHIHIPSISLKEIPIHRAQLRLKLYYGTKKITTFNADLSNRHVTKDSFSLLWQPSDVNGDAISGNPSYSMTSIVKFPFETASPKDLSIELSLFDKLLLQKKDVIKLSGKINLESLLPSPGYKACQKNVQITLTSSNNSNIGKEYVAKINASCTVSLNRELELEAGDYIDTKIKNDSRLWSFIHAASLNKSVLENEVQVSMATHRLVDHRDGATYIVQIVHSATYLLSMIIVYDSEQRLLSMAHLIGSDSLPCKGQLDANLQFLPHLSAPEERIFLVSNRDGDFSIVKGSWSGYVKKNYSDKHKNCKQSHAGHLKVELFNLLRNTIQKLQLPAPDGSTLFIIGDAQARLSGKRFHCRSPMVAEHIASIFAVSTLFVLCNPDRIHDKSDTSHNMCHSSHKWPMTVASGYGKRIMYNDQQSSNNDWNSFVDITPAFLVSCSDICDGYNGFDGVAACGNCGGCGGGGCGGCA
uniref:ApaG domain-containing protein n=1 Tax=Strongyloides venezuelensis TaxID=75913 RepID=A0A0K0FY40_STRVS